MRTLKIPHGAWKDYSNRIPECDHDEKDHSPKLLDKNVFDRNGKIQMWKCSKCKCQITVGSMLFEKWCLNPNHTDLGVFYRYYPNAKKFYDQILRNR